MTSIFFLSMQICLVRLQQSILKSKLVNCYRKLRKHHATQWNHIKNALEMLFQMKRAETKICIIFGLIVIENSYCNVILYFCFFLSGIVLCSVDNWKACRSHSTAFFFVPFLVFCVICKIHLYHRIFAQMNKKKEYWWENRFLCQTNKPNRKNYQFNQWLVTRLAIDITTATHKKTTRACNQMFQISICNLH